MLGARALRGVPVTSEPPVPLREVGWPAPEDPDAGGDPELDGRNLIAERLDDEAEWLRQAAGWLTQLDAGGYPPVVNLRPSDDRDR